MNMNVPSASESCALQMHTESTVQKELCKNWAKKAIKKIAKKTEKNSTPSESNYNSTVKGRQGKNFGKLLDALQFALLFHHILTNFRNCRHICLICARRSGAT